MSESKKYRDTDLGDGAHVVYIPWEETPWGGTTPKPEGYDEMYAEFGLGPLVDCEEGALQALDNLYDKNDEGMKRLAAQ
jgi:hypothetical protein